ncbi:MAG: hypothetical protein E3J23_08630 [Candidatus Stahlbacteria bacterium]|nr:MAG: hypothetical protein E3J23_08630 [Candidatus Stahlbacteria bacterium]
MLTVDALLKMRKEGLEQFHNEMKAIDQAYTGVNKRHCTDREMEEGMNWLEDNWEEQNKPAEDKKDIK